jgi:hypothetical protein
MDELKTTLERLLTEAADCAAIGKLATYERKHDLFGRLAADLRGMAFDVQAMIALENSSADGGVPKPRGPG